MFGSCRRRWSTSAPASCARCRHQRDALEALPDVPTVGEIVPGYEASAWYGIGVPKGTPAEIVELLNREINAGLADAKMKAQLTDLGGTVLPGSPADFGRMIADETAKWSKVVRFSGAKRAD